MIREYFSEVEKKLIEVVDIIKVVMTKRGIE